MFKFKLSSFVFPQRISIRLSTFNLLLACWLGVALNAGFYAKIYALTPYGHIQSLGFIAATVLIVVATYSVVLQLFSWRHSAKILAALLMIIGGWSAYFVNSLGVLMTADQIQNMQQTDLREVADLWSMPMLVWSFGLIVLPLLFLSRLNIHVEAIQQQIQQKLIHSAAAVAVILSLLFAFYVDYAAIFREHRDLKAMLSPQNTLAAGLKYYQHKTPKADLPLLPYGTDAQLAAKSQAAPKLMVLVVGETARAESFALNGYPRQTNPELSKLKLLNFQQVSSCSTATAVSVPCMFSGMPRTDYDEQLASHREGLLDLAQRAGYEVTWIDNNSGCKGVCNRVTQYQIPQAIKQKWCDAHGECLDEILVDSLKDYLRHLSPNNNKPQLLVLHQMGSHGPAYFKRSKAPYQPFQPMCQSNAIQGCSPNELKNAYDNSIVYTDHVLAQIIHTLQQPSRYQTAFWYLSDHGESTGEHGLYLHGAPYALAPSQQTHVPMLMWFSQAWQKHSAAQVACLAAQQDSPLSHDMLFPSLLSVLDIKSQVIDHKNDMLKHCSSAMPERV